jgi:hypothetical protein
MRQCAAFFGGEGLMQFGARAYRSDELWRLVAATRKWQSTFGSPVAKTSLEQGLIEMRSIPDVAAA